MLDGIVTPTEMDSDATSRTRSAETHLREFARQAWSVLLPNRNFVPGRHIDAICDHLEAVTRGQIKDLVINIPPRHGKSNLTCVFWPAWSWIQNPSTCWLFSSYKQELATRDSVACRRVIASRWYQERWGDRFQLATDQNIKTRFDNDRSGFRLAITSGTGTGEGGDVIVVDDPHNIEEAESPNVRKAVLDWWDHTMATRRNDPQHSARVIIMQRLHESDLAGHVLESGEYVHLNLPAEYDADAPPPRLYHVRPNPLGWKDWRTTPGELLWPDRYTDDILHALKDNLGPYSYAGQFQQRPVPAEGGMFKEFFFPKTDGAPEDCQWVRYWDKAATEGAGDYSATVLIGKKLGIYYIAHALHGQWSPRERNEIIHAVALSDRERYGYNVATWFEQEPGSGGKESAMITAQLLAGFNVHIEPVTGQKETRARPFAAQAAVGNVRVVSAPWNTEYINELLLFPNGKHDDYVDCSSGAFNKLSLTPKWEFF